jgi:hypothetical protein
LRSVFGLVGCMNMHSSPPGERPDLPLIDLVTADE